MVVATYNGFTFHSLFKHFHQPIHVHTAEPSLHPLLPETLKLQKRLNWAQIHLSKSLLPWLNFVKHETTQLLQCQDERFLVYFSCIKFCLLRTPSDRISSIIELYMNPCVGPECKNLHQRSYCPRARVCGQKLQKKNMVVLKLPRKRLVF